MGRALLLHNPAARSAPGTELLKALVRELTQRGLAVHAAKSERPGHLAELARAGASEGYGRIVVCGGDGSVREAAEGLFGTGVPLAIIPLGTMNVTAHEMALPVQDPLACAAVAGGGRPQSVGLGTVGGRAFTFSASCGLDALAVENVSPGLKESTGGFAYGASALASLLRGGFPVFEVETESGDRFEACQVFAARARRYGGRDIFLSSRADLRSPTMRLIALPPPLMRHLASLPRFLSVGLDGAPGTICLEVRMFRLHADAPLPIQADGDGMPVVHPEFISHPDALQLVFPE